MAHTISLFYTTDTNALRAILAMQVLILVGISIVLFGQLVHVPGKHARANGRRRVGDPDGHSDGARRFEMGRAKLVKDGRLAPLDLDGKAPGPGVAGVGMARRSGVLRPKRTA